MLKSIDLMRALSLRVHYLCLVGMESYSSLKKNPTFWRNLTRMIKWFCIENFSHWLEKDLNFGHAIKTNFRYLLEAFHTNKRYDFDGAATNIIRDIMLNLYTVLNQQVLLSFLSLFFLLSNSNQ